MTWLFWLTAAVIVTGIVAVFGTQPKGTRPVGHTRMMHMGRLVLIVVILVVAYAMFRARNGG
jgi:hypothetical protein